MDPDFWHQRWQENRIGFHQDRVTPLLEQYWASLGLPADTRVFVPLAGKSMDLAWLAAQGHRVLGVELSQLAIEQFFADHDLMPDVRQTGHAHHYRAGNIELICGDIFKLDPGTVSGCSAVFDRAALIALPPDLQRRYADEVYTQLPTGCRGLLITLDYPQHQKQGPPFSITTPDVHALFDRDWDVCRLQRCDILAEQPRFLAEGVGVLHTTAFRLDRR